MGFWIFSQYLHHGWTSSAWQFGHLGNFDTDCWGCHWIEIHHQMFSDSFPQIHAVSQHHIGWHNKLTNLNLLYLGNLFDMFLSSPHRAQAFCICDEDGRPRPTCLLLNVPGWETQRTFLKHGYLLKHGYFMLFPFFRGYLHPNMNEPQIKE
jgi:hypothetical protein